MNLAHEQGQTHQLLPSEHKHAHMHCSHCDVDRCQLNVHTHTFLPLCIISVAINGFAAHCNIPTSAQVSTTAPNAHARDCTGRMCTPPRCAAPYVEPALSPIPPCSSSCGTAIFQGSGRPGEEREGRENWAHRWDPEQSAGVSKSSAASITRMREPEIGLSPAGWKEKGQEATQMYVGGKTSGIPGVYARWLITIRFWANSCMH